MGVQTQLFVDDEVIERIDGLHRVFHQTKRHPRDPIVKPEHPWEGAAFESPIVFWNDEFKLFRMYYWAMYRGSWIPDEYLLGNFPETFPL